MAARRALSSYDILTEIFEYFSLARSAGIWDRLDSTFALVKCARVSKAFSDIALDILWRDLYGLLPLFQLFSSFVKDVGPDEPPDDWEEAEPMDEPEQYSDYLNGTITPEEWTVFEKYARRVRTLTYYGGSSVALDDVLHYHRAHFGDRPVLPRLHEFSWRPSYALDTNIRHLFSQSFRRVTIAFQDDSHGQGQDHDLQEVLDALSHQAPLLEEFRIRDFGRPFLLRPLLTRCGRLRKLAILGFAKILDRQFFVFLSALPYLEELWISCEHIHMKPVTLASLHALFKLKISGIIAQIVSVLEIISCPNIHTLDITNTQVDSSPHDLVQLMELVWSSSGTSLHSIFYSNAGSFIGDESLLDLVRPLLQTPRLQFVDLQFGLGPWGLPDTDVRDIASAWPELRSFRLSADKSSSRPELYPIGRMPSMGSLAIFAQLCPSLVKLALPFIVDSGYSNSDESHWTTSHSLQELDIDYICPPGIRNPSQTAQFLDSIFPNLDIPLSFQQTSLAYLLLEDFECIHPIIYRRHEGWGTVAQLMEELQTARTE
ncbi:hypothetical protein BKA93DRAFT_747140 [Sparassis latifolia]